MKRALLLAALATLSGVAAGCSTINLEAPREYPCEPDAGAGTAADSQCPADYRCGLERRCHPVGEARAYLCAADSQCEAGWRCGPEGTCVDPSTDALRPSASGAPSIARLSPLTDTVGARLFAAGNSWEVDPCGTGNATYRVHPTATVTDTGVSAVYWWERGRPATATGAVPPCGADPSTLGVQYVDLATAPLPPAAVVDLAVSRDRVVMLLPGGAYCVGVATPGQPDLAVSCHPAGSLGFNATHLRAAPSAPDLMVAFNAQKLAVIHLGPQTVSGLTTVPAFDGGLARIDDVLLEGADGGAVHPVLAATPEGVLLGSLEQPSPFEGPIADGGWQLASTGSDCYAPENRAFAADRFYLVGQYPTFLVVGQQHPPAGYDEPHFAVLKDQGTSSFTPQCASIPTPDWSVGYSSTFVEDNRCTNLCNQVGEQLAGAQFGVYYPPSTGPSFTGPNLRTVQQCVLDGGAPGHLFIDPTGCDGSNIVAPRTPRWSRPALPSTTNAQASAHADDLGHLWVDPRFEGEQAVLLDRAPTAVFGDVATGLLVATSTLTSGLSSGNQEVGVGQLFGLDSRAGLVGEDTLEGASIETGVDGEPRWGVVKLPSGGSFLPTSIFLFQMPVRLEDGVKILALGKFGESFERPFHAASFLTPQGSEIALVTSGDALLASDVTNTARDGGVDFESSFDLATLPQLEVKIIPLPRNDITALTVLPRSASEDAGTQLFAEGYLLASGRLFRFVAPNPVVWKDEELLLPVEGVPTALFHDGPRGRIGYLDGTVLSLPTRVPLSDPLPPGAGDAVDFAQLCEHTAVLAQHGVFTLTAAAGEPKGTWTPISLPASSLPAGSADFTGGRLVAAGGDLLLFHPLGWAYRITGLGCTP